ncbi:MAG: hypothetical protein ABII79_03975 [bacterium]
MTRAVLFAIMGLHCFVAAQEPRPDVEITRFALNPSYGISKSVDLVSGNMNKYLLLKFDSERVSENEFIIIDSVVSTSKPQLCDSNAVSFIATHGTDSAMLIVVDFDTLTKLDTIVTYPVEDLRSKVSYRRGQNHLYNLDGYLFYRPDSLLFWRVPVGRYSIIETGRVTADRSYLYEDWCMLCDLPVFIGDFSMALWARGQRFPTIGEQTPIIAYDFEQDSCYVLRFVTGNCWSPQLLHRDDQLFCFCDGPGSKWSFCIVEDSIPRPLHSIGYPVQFGECVLYHDSVVIRTESNCDKDYGIQTHVILR